MTIVAAILLSIAVWFVGPLLGFGDFSLLKSIGIRIISIVIILALPLFLIAKWPIGVVFVAAACLLLWRVAPLFHLDEMYPFEPVWIRVSLIATLILCYAGYKLYRLWQNMRNDPEFLQRILRPSGDKPAATERADMQAVGVAVSKAMSQLKRMRRIPLGWQRLIESGRYLYELPWYMLIGTPGAGKTTAVLSSGLEFPLAEQMGARSMRKEAGTVNCDWWFTNEAVLIDTAGRYTDQKETQNENGTEANATEWKGFLGLLRKHRPRAPVNGAILAISVDELVHKSESERMALAANMRARLSEMRYQLGIRFPVYVLVTKLDLLPGFTEYFQSLTVESRSQIWGFTLPYRNEKEEGAGSDLRQLCIDEFRSLEERVDAGLNNRLLEEYESERRKKLYPLPQEFRSLSALVVETISLIFLDSKYDDTQLQSILRGVYFTSAEQTGQTVLTDRNTLLQRLKRKLSQMQSNEGAEEEKRSESLVHGHRGYFLRSIFQQVIVPEAHLVRPNFRWELRFRALRWLGHVLAITVFIWLVGGMIVSFGNNNDYLAVISKKIDTLAARVQDFNKAPKKSAIVDVLEKSRDLPQYSNLNLSAPGGAYRYGLYVAPSIINASDVTYLRLLHEILLPQIMQRVEESLTAQLNVGDSASVYQTLTIYLMLYDASHFDAKLIKAWVQRDWERSENALVLGNRSTMIQHLEALFVDGRPVKPTASQNIALIQRARAFLNQNQAPKRLYERAMSAMAADAPENFTLAHAVGFQGMTIFTLAEGTAFGDGVPGLYTYDGYHQVFKKRLPEFLAQAQREDAWVMGRTELSKWASLAKNKISVFDDIRRQYLTDYGNYWQQFIADIRPVAASDQGAGGTLALDLESLRILAAPDSPLPRLTRLVMHETTLTRATGPGDSVVSDMAINAVGRKSYRAQTAVTAGKKLVKELPTLKLEKELVDNRFTALREVVTGKPDTGNGSVLADYSVAAEGRPLQLTAIMTLLNEQYTRLVVANNALAADTMPPVLDIGTTLRIEAEKLPAPFHAILAGVSSQSADKVGREIGSLLRLQMETSVGESCRRAISGKYPFSPSSQEVDIEDFNRIFAAGGLLDGFFQKSLASYVDTSVKPWRYKPLSPGMPAMQGPSLEPFERAAAIREIFFRESGAKRMAWKMDVKISAMDPEITELMIDIDGQGTRYAHGPETPFSISWPGPRGGSTAEITAYPRVRPDTSTLIATGPWALFRLLERGRLSETASASRALVEFSFDGRHTTLELLTGSQFNPLTTRLLKDFQCPGEVT